MYSACRNNALLLAALLAVAGCARERREFEPPAPSTAPPAATSISPITAGGAALDTGVRDSRQQQYGDNAWHISRGKTLYGAFNCYGCHAWGGGDIGPPLMDDKWIYG